MADDVRPSKVLWQQVVATYDAALASGACAKTDTDVQVLRDERHGVDFVLRIAVALRDKPKPPKDSGGQAAWRNPFLPPEPALTVGPLPPVHTLVLNKFNVLPHHLLVITREYEEQAALAARDFDALLPVLRCMPQGGLAFYNCGEASGASQPHKHIQVVPLPLAEGQPVEPPFDAHIRGACDEEGLAAQPLPGLPFQAYACRPPASVNGAELHAAYASLLASAGHPRSYNLVVTRRFMMLTPRTAEGVGPVSVNSMGFAGSFFVRSVAELEYVRAEGPMQVLARVGVPW